MHWEREIPSDFQAETCVGMPVTAHLKASHPPALCHPWLTRTALPPPPCLSVSSPLLHDMSCTCVRIYVLEITFVRGL